MKDQVWTRSRRYWPMISCGDWFVLLVLVFSTGGVAFWGAATERWFVASLSVLVGFAVSVLFLTRNLGAEARRIGFLLPLPIVLGLALSYHPSLGSVPILIGMVLTVALFLWYKVFRHPPEYRSAAKMFYAGDMARTRELLGASIEQNPAHWQSYYFRAVASLFLVQFVEAEQDVRAALRLQPNQHPCHAALGSALIAQGRYAEAKAAYSRALELARGYAVNYYGKGLACFRLQEFEEAAKLFRIAVRGKLPYVEQQLFAHYYLGHSLLQIGKSTEAQSAFRSMKRFRQGYEKTLTRYQDAPEYPGVADLRQELQEIKKHLDGSAT